MTDAKKEGRDPVLVELRSLSKRMVAAYRWCMRSAASRLDSLDTREANANQGAAWLKAAQMAERRADAIEKRKNHKAQRVKTSRGALTGRACGPRQ